MTQDVDERKGSHWTRGGFVHRAVLLCPSCGGTGFVQEAGAVCAACMGTGKNVVGCGGEAEVDPYWTPRGMGANCMSCDSLIPQREVTPFDSLDKLNREIILIAELGKLIWVKVGEGEIVS